MSKYLPSHKRCPRCGIIKEQISFNLSGTRPDGLQTYCIECQRPMKQDAHLKRTYGITQGQYDKILKSQNGVCAICGNPETSLSNNGVTVVSLAVDHNHKTGRVRGLLCNQCNILLGTAKDDIEILDKAIKYLKGKRHGN